MTGATGPQGLTGFTGAMGPAGNATNTGATGPGGTILIQGTNYGDYLYWNGSSWAVGDQKVSIGKNTGNSSQGNYAIAVGSYAGQTSQGSNTIAMGKKAGQISQGGSSIAMGAYAGQTGQGTNAIAMGRSAGNNGQGTNAIAIGQSAGQNKQPANSIVLNASGNTLNGANTNAFYVNPIRGNTGAAGAKLLSWDTSSSEIYLNTSKTFVIDHPNNQEKYLVHACLEGPESGVYYRGKGEIINDTSVSILLPEYVNNLAYDFTVQITPIYDGKTIKTYNVSDVNNNQFTVYGINGKFNWLLQGSRGPIHVEPYKNEVEVKGTGPYKWL